MRTLFSPWRSSYIQTFKSGKKSKRCLLCQIARSPNDEANLVIWRGTTSYVVLNRFPYNSGHMMIVPYRHTRDFAGLTQEEATEVMAVAGRCISALEKLSAPHGFNFGANLGRVAGAGIDGHIHFHVVPRWNGDTNFMPVLADTKVISEDMKKTWRELRKAMKS